MGARFGRAETLGEVLGVSWVFILFPEALGAAEKRGFSFLDVAAGQ